MSAPPTLEGPRKEPPPSSWVAVTSLLAAVGTNVGWLVSAVLGIATLWYGFEVKKLKERINAVERTCQENHQEVNEMLERKADKPSAV